MKVGIIGYSGFVGSAFLKVFSKDKQYSIVGINRKNYNEMRKVHFDILINADGNSSKILAEKNPQLDFEMNVLSTLKFLYGLTYNQYVHISTIEVYNDKSTQKTTSESQKIDPTLLSSYGFSKYCAEIVVQQHAKNWIILRLGGMVGENMKKGPVYDTTNLGKIFVSEKSRFQFIDTIIVANIAKHLLERKRFGEIYNIAGKGNIRLSEFAQQYGIRFSSVGKEELHYNVNTKKIEREFKIPTSKSIILEFIKKNK